MGCHILDSIQLLIWTLHAKKRNVERAMDGAVQKE